MSLASPSARLDRLLAYLKFDEGNLFLRKDAVQEACACQQYDVARRLIDAGLSAHEGEPDLLALSGLVHLHAKEYAKAQGAFSAAMAQGLEEPGLRYHLALTQYMQGLHLDAIESLGDLQAFSEVQLPARMLRIRCLHHLQRLDEAIADCEAGLELWPDDAQMHGVLALLLHERSRSEEAKPHIASALQHDPTQLEALLAQASALHGAGNYEAARLAFEALLQAHPDCGRGWHGLAMVKLAHFELDDAKHDIEQAAKTMPEHVGTWHMLAWIQLLRGDVDAAEEAFKAALALDRNFGETHGGLAAIAALRGQEEQARAGIARARRLNSQSMSTEYAQAILLLQRGDAEGARRIVEAFQDRPALGGQMPLRDFVAAHLSYLQAHAAGNAGRKSFLQ